MSKMMGIFSRLTAVILHCNQLDRVQSFQTGRHSSISFHLIFSGSQWSFYAYDIERDAGTNMEGEGPKR